MSSISGVGQNLYQFLQGASVDSPPQPAITVAPAATADTSTATQQVEGGGDHHHHGGGKVFQSIQSAVTTALQSAQSSGDDADPNQIVQSAIEQALQSFQGTASDSATQTGNAPDGTTDVTNDDDSSPGSTFAQLLQSNGIDAQQFHQDFLAAIKSAQNGGPADASSIFSHFPPGSVVDTSA